MALSEPDMVVLLGTISAVLLALALGAGIVAALKTSEVAGLHNRLLSLGYPVDGDDTPAASATPLALPLPTQTPETEAGPETVPTPVTPPPAAPVIKAQSSDAAHTALERSEPLIKTGQRYVELSADATYTLGVINDVLEWLNRHPDDAEQVRRLSQAALTASRHLTRQVRTLNGEKDA